MPFTETVEVKMTSSASGEGLSSFIKQLRDVDGYINQINASLAGLRVGPNAARSVAQLKAEIASFNSKGAVGKSSLVEGLKLDAAAFDKYLAETKNKLRGYNDLKKEFRSGSQAATAIAGFEKQQTRLQGSTSLGQLLGTPTLSQVGGAGINASLAGQINLIIPASQISAVVSGQITATGAGGGGGGGTGVGGEVVGAVGGARGSLASALRQQKRLEMETLKAAKIGLSGDFFGLAKLQEQTADNLGALITDKMKADLAATPAKLAALEKIVNPQIEILRAEAKTNLARHEAALAGGGTAAARAAQDEIDTASRARRAMAKFEARASTDAARDDTGEKSRAALAKFLVKAEEDAARDTKLAATMAAQNAAASVKAAAQRSASIQASLANPPAGYATAGTRAPFGTAQFIPALPAPPPIIPPPVIPATSPAAQSFFGKALAGFAPAAFVQNIAKVTSWAAAVGVLYKTIDLASYSLGRLIDVGAQTARLGQVFNKVGGTAQELTMDVMKLASENGRSTDEAVESAIQWSRLGLNRAQVNEAVRVSLIAANVAELDAAEATKHLSSLMAAYQFSVGDLAGVLGQLNNTSNTYNVTNKDLLNGLSRSAAVAKQAGLSFADLQGIIGAAVGRTGQTGATIGNAVKSIAVALSDPNVQSFLRNQLKLDVSTSTGDIKTMPKILAELSVTYAGLTNAERQNLAARVAGKTQAARFVAILESYTQAQALAIDGQLNLNSAEQENIKIKGSLKSQLVGITAAWDALIVKQGNVKGGLAGTPLDQITEGAKAVKNLINLAGTARLPALFGGDQIVKVFNALNTDPAVAGMEKYQASIKAASSAWGGLTQRAALFRTDAAKLAIGRPEELAASAKINAKAIGGDAGRELMLAVKLNDTKRAQAIYETAALDSQKKAGIASKESNSKREIGIAALTESIQKEKELTLAGGQTADGLERQKKLEQDLTTLLDQKRIFEDEIEMKSEGGIGRRQKLLNLEAEHLMMLENINQAYQQMPADSLTDKLDNRIAALRAQAEELTKMHDRVSGMGANPDTDAIIAQLDLAREKNKADVAAATSGRGFSQFMDARAIAGRRALEESAGMKVGPDDASKLLAQQAELQFAITAAKQKFLTTSPGRESDTQAVRLATLEVELIKNKQEIQTRIVALRAEEQQITQDTLREQNKALLFSSPSELLKRLAIDQLGPGVKTAGDFFAMGPDARKLFDESRGGDAGARNRRERELLGPGMTVEEEIAASQRANPRAVNTILGQGIQPFISAQNSLELEARAKAAAEMKNFGEQLGGAAALLGSFSAAVQAALDTIARGIWSGGNPNGAIPQPQASGFRLGYSMSF